MLAIQNLWAKTWRKKQNQTISDRKAVSLLIPINDGETSF